MRIFDPADYPHGCRCACCNGLFREGDEMHPREVAENWDTPTCATCAATDAALVPDHPFRPGNSPIACADGMMR